MGFALSELCVSSTAFSAGGAIPRKHTGEGEDVSPALTWTDAPEGTRSFAIFCHDPDAPLVTGRGDYGFVHWVLCNIPAGVAALAEGTGEYTPGQNSFGNLGYGGPMPPPGHGRHHYYFWVLALDREPGLAEGLTLDQLLTSVEPHLLGMNRLVGTYERS